MDRHYRLKEDVSKGPSVANTGGPESLEPLGQERGLC